MKAKPIISTPVMNLDPAHRQDYFHGDRLMLCVHFAAPLFGFKAESPPKRIRLHVHEQPSADGVSVQFRYEQSKPAWTEVQWWGTVSTFWGHVYQGLGAYLLKSKSLGNRLRAGETVTLYVELEVVEAG